MRLFLILILIILLFEGCFPSDNLKFIEGANASTSYIEVFFNLQQKINSIQHTLLFFKDQKKEPYIWINVGKDELERSKKFNLSNCEILVLYNPGNTSTNIFCKMNGSLEKTMLESKYYPDKIKFYNYLDTIGILEFSFVDEPNIANKYYFFTVKQGFLETGITTSIMIPRSIQLKYNKINVEMHSERAHSIIELRKKGTIYRDLSHKSDNLIIFPHQIITFDSMNVERW